MWLRAETAIASDSDSKPSKLANDGRRFVSPGWRILQPFFAFSSSRIFKWCSDQHLLTHLAQSNDLKPGMRH